MFLATSDTCFFLGWCYARGLVKTPVVVQLKGRLTDFCHTMPGLSRVCGFCGSTRLAKEMSPERGFRPVPSSSKRAIHLVPFLFGERYLILGSLDIESGKRRFGSFFLIYFETNRERGCTGMPEAEGSPSDLRNGIFWLSRTFTEHGADQSFTAFDVSSHLFARKGACSGYPWEQGRYLVFVGGHPFLFGLKGHHKNKRSPCWGPGTHTHVRYAMAEEEIQKDINHPKGSLILRNAYKAFFGPASKGARIRPEAPRFSKRRTCAGSSWQSTRMRWACPKKARETGFF